MYVLYEIEICWRYGMAVLHPARARQVCAPKRHKHPIFGFGRILAFLAKKYFASNVPYVCRYLACAHGIKNCHTIPPTYFDVIWNIQLEQKLETIKNRSSFSNFLPIFLPIFYRDFTWEIEDFWIKNVKNSKNFHWPNMTRYRF